MVPLSSSQLLPADATLAMDVSRALRETLPIEQVIVFGSRARGEAKDDSDLDLLVLIRGKRPSDVSRQVWETLWCIQRNHKQPISPLILSAEEWHHGVYQATLLKKEVERDGVIL